MLLKSSKTFRLMDDICRLSLRELHRAYRRRDLSPVDVVDAFLDRIERLNPRLNAFVTVTAEAARQSAKVAERRLATGEPLPFMFGIPFSVKDTLPTANVRTTFGTTLFSEHVPTEDAAVVAALKRSGGILLGKTNSPAFGWTAVTDNRLFGDTPNPWNSKFIAGGSSGGTAVAALTALAPLNIGTDGGGSLRVPAAFTETVGFKASYGRVPNYPMGAGWAIQHIGAITRTVEDAVIAFDSIAVPDARDLYSLPQSKQDVLLTLDNELPPQRIIYCESLGYTQVLDPEVARICRAAVQTFRDLGCTVEEANPSWPSPESIWMTLFAAGLANRLKPFGPRFDELEPELRTIVEAQINEPDDYLQACLDRNAWWDYPRAVFEQFDLLITPMTARPPFERGRFSPGTIAEKPITFYGWIPYTYPFNLTGQPAISLPAGRTESGLPVGIQIVGARFDDALVLQAARSYERARPPLAAWSEQGRPAAP
jgi:aspartyl-tRNA(Asn)/glutamyl-tRNA(Gln) amidotransferase subunit A